MLRYVEVNHTPAAMREHYQDKQDPKRGDRNGEEIDRDQFVHMVFQESLPRLGGRLPTFGHQSGDRSLRDSDSVFHELPMNAGCAPQGIGFCHLVHQVPKFATHSRPTGPLSPGHPGPEKAESSPMPADDGFRSHEEQSLSPIRPGP